jgi:glycerol-3-phosphate dehydrogenase
MSLSPIRAEFSFRTRQHDLARLKNELFDLLIIGGGITGAGIARDAALRGFKVALVEKDDYASGTSSRSSKLVHGGLRYLEHFQFHLVFEASRERRLLLHLAPSLVYPLPFLYPIYRDTKFPPWMIEIGMWLYDALALFRNYGLHQRLTTEQIAARVPVLDTANIVGGEHYYDAQVDDARLTLENVRSAHLHGAVIVNHVRVEGLLRSLKGRVEGIHAHTREGERITARARVVVNATGPWTDQISHLDDPRAGARIRPTKGTHLLVSRDKFKIDSAMSFTVARDGRLMFVIPWDGFCIVGTTDTDYRGDYDQVHADQADVNYILETTNHAFPGARLQKSDVVGAYAGLRPLVAENVGKKEGEISREHKIWRTPSGLVCIAGGKLTTYRSMAEELVDKVARILAGEFNIHAPRPALTARLLLVEPSAGNEKARESVLKRLSEKTVAHLNRAYGARMGRVLDYVVDQADLEQAMVEGLPYIWAEVPHALEHEMALDVADVLARRMHFLMEARDGGVSVAPGVAAWLAKFLNWDAQESAQAVENYAREVEKAREF